MEGISMKSYKFGLILTFLIFFLNSSISHAADINWFEDTSVVESEVGSKYTLGTGSNRFGIDFIAIKKSDSKNNIDISFGEEGISIIHPDLNVNLDFQTPTIDLHNGKVIAGISSTAIKNNGNQFKYSYIIRLNNDGTLDTSFGDNNTGIKRFII